MRKIIIGKNSNLYKEFKKEFDEIFDLAISHKDLHNFVIKKTDIYFILSYGQSEKEMSQLLSEVIKIKQNNVILLSTTAIIVSKYSKCYAYPKLKMMQENFFSAKMSNFIIYRVGTVLRKNNLYHNRGTCVLNSDLFFRTLKKLLSGEFVCQVVEEYEFVRIEKNTLESIIYFIYTVTIRLFYKFPCVLRPIDLILKILNYRWYGYGALSLKLLRENKV